MTGNCCDLHGRNCEPPSELCCEQCTEADHPQHLTLGPCSNPDLSPNSIEPTNLHDRIAEQAWGVLVAAGPPEGAAVNVIAHAIATNVLTVLPTAAGGEIEQRALGNAIDKLDAIAGIVKLAQHEPRKDAWRSIDAIARILDEEPT